MSAPGPKTFVAKSAPVHQLSIKDAFEGLKPKERLYAHYMSRASWHGARIILRQTSPEAEEIFEWIIALYNRCSGDWTQFQQSNDLSETDLQALLVYAACFLSNIGNYYGSGDQKFVPDLSVEALRQLLLSPSGIDSILSIPPYNLGFPGKESQSMYYPGAELLTKSEISRVSEVLEQRGVHPENTRISKDSDSSGHITYRVSQASSIRDKRKERDSMSDTAEIVFEQGDHARELEMICEELRLAIPFAANDIQRQTVQLYIQSFETGDLNFYRDALKLWVSDRGPKVEHIMGFVEPYRDPLGVRAEFEGLVAIADPGETETLHRLVEHSDQFIKTLPWCHNYTQNNGKGPFEKTLFDPPDFASIHVLAYCSSIIFPGINLPNYNDIRQDCGFKNVIIANRMTAESSNLIPSPYVDAAEIDRFQKSKFPAYYIWVVLHELFGHGTGKMMHQYDDHNFNFAHQSPPINPLNGSSIESWYLPGQTWTGQFKDLATTVDECRAELVGAYLMDDPELLALFGYTADTEITAADITYSVYMQVATDGLRGLMNFNVDSQSWGQAHSRAHFAMLKCLLRDGQGCVKINFSEAEEKITVLVDDSKIIPDGKAALGKMLLHLHMYRCTADAQSCRKYYEDLSSVDGEYLDWRRLVLALQPPKWVFVHANTFLDDDNVVLKEYSATPEGVIQSWAERKI